jgi:hypothetical protein
MKKVSAEGENSCVRVRSNACSAFCNLRAGHKKKKMHRVSAQGLSKQLPIFWLQRHRSARQNPVQIYLRATVQGGVSGQDKQLQNFLFSMHQYGLFFLLLR